MKPFEIEVDGPRNECLAFRPLPGTTIRGRFDLAKVTEPMARLNEAQWPMVVPGQRLGIDNEGIGYISEPLHDSENAPIKEKIEKAGMKLEPALQTFEGIDQPSWVYWMMRAVQAGLAKAIKGQMPSELPKNARTNYIMAEPQPTASDKLTAAIERQNALMAQLLERLGK